MGKGFHPLCLAMTPNKQPGVLHCSNFISVTKKNQINVMPNEYCIM